MAHDRWSERDLDSVGDRRRGDKLHEPESDDPCQAVSRFVSSVGGAGGVAQVGFGAFVITYADETDFKLSTTAAGPLRCDEHVHVGVSPVPHIIHEADLPAEEVHVAKEGRTVQEHAEEIFLLPGCFLSGEGRWGKACSEEERAEDSLDHFVLFVTEIAIGPRALSQTRPQVRHREAAKGCTGIQCSYLSLTRHGPRLP